MGRHHNGEYDEREQKSAQAKLKPRKTIPHKRTGENLQQGVDNTEQQRIAQSREIPGQVHNINKALCGKMPRDPNNRRIQHIGTVSKSKRYHINQRIQNNKGETYEQKESEYFPQYSGKIGQR